MVFDTNLKKSNLKQKIKIKLFFVFLHYCAVNSLPVTPFCHAKSHFGMKEAFKTFSGFSNEIQTPLCKMNTGGGGGDEHAKRA